MDFSQLNNIQDMSTDDLSRVLARVQTGTAGSPALCGVSNGDGDFAWPAEFQSEHFGLDVAAFLLAGSAIQTPATGDLPSTINLSALGGGSVDGGHPSSSSDNESSNGGSPEYRPASLSLSPPALYQTLDQQQLQQQTEAAARRRVGGSKRGAGRRPKYIRTKTGCLCCRAKRVKCDEEHPNCKRCRNANRECVWPSAADGAASVHERRTSGGSISEHSGSASSSPDKRPILLPAASGGGSIRSERGIGRTVTTTTASTKTPAGQPNRVRIVRPVETAFKSFPLPSSVGSARTSVSPSASPNLVPATIADPAVPTSGGIVISPRSIYLSPPEPVDESAISATAAGSLLSPQYLLPWFPTAEERGLILHFCQHSATLLMARPVEAGVNPILATLLPLALSAPRGFSISTDALRLSLLAIAATHQAYLLSKSGTPGPVLSKSLDLAIGLRTDARVLARSADSKVRGDKGDALFAATVVLGIVDILLGGHAWTQNFDLAKAIVANRGGVEAMLAASASITLKEGVEVSRTRLLLEILVTHEIFGSFVTAEVPSPLLSGDWFSDAAQTTAPSYHVHSVDVHFGVSRSTLGILSRVSGLMSRASAASSDVPEVDGLAEFDQLFLQDFDFSAAAATPTQVSEPDVVSIRKDALEVLAAIETAIANLSGTGPAEDRLTQGNLAYLHTAKLLILRSVFRSVRSDGRVQAAALQILENCSAAVASGLTNHLTWPMIVAATQVNAAARPWALTILEGLRRQNCFNVDSGARIIRETWDRLDRGSDWSDWKSVLNDLEMKVLLT